MKEIGLSRDERQDWGIEKWKQSKGRATCLYPTGFGKTRVALKTIRRVRARNPNAKIIVVVPTDYLQRQWHKELTLFDLQGVEVLIINTAIKNDYECDLLIIDEVHIMVAQSFSRVFHKVKYKLLLCLTGTLDRLDGKEVLLKNYAPICDVITLNEAVSNGWVAEFKQYKVFIDVDLEAYNIANSAFMHHFSFFNHNFDLALSCVKNIQARRDYMDDIGCTFSEVTAHAMAWMHNMKLRTAFVYDHPKKIEIANKILNARMNKKIITFTKHVSHAKQLCCGEIYHGRMSDKKKEKVMDDFNAVDVGIMNSCQALNVGADVQGVNTIIIISGDSSSITKRQRIGRGIRKEEDKIAEIWHLVLRNTTEESWYRKSSKDLKSHTLNEKQLDELLASGEYGSSDEENLLFKF